MKDKIEICNAQSIHAFLATISLFVVQDESARKAWHVQYSTNWGHAWWRFLPSGTQDCGGYSWRVSGKQYLASSDFLAEQFSPPKQPRLKVFVGFVLLLESYKFSGKSGNVVVQCHLLRGFCFPWIQFRLFRKWCLFDKHVLLLQGWTRKTVHEFSSLFSLQFHSDLCVWWRQGSRRFHSLPKKKKKKKETFPWSNPKATMWNVWWAVLCLCCKKNIF